MKPTTFSVFSIPLSDISSSKLHWHLIFNLDKLYFGTLLHLVTIYSADISFWPHNVSSTHSCSLSSLFLKQTSYLTTYIWFQSTQYLHLASYIQTNFSIIGNFVSSISLDYYWLPPLYLQPLLAACCCSTGALWLIFLHVNIASSTSHRQLSLGNSLSTKFTRQ